MKTTIVTLLILCSAHLMSNELSWVDEQIEAIQPPRVGMLASQATSINDPFIFLSKNGYVKSEQANANATSLSGTSSQTKKVSTVLTLGMTMNKSAMINSNWYNIGDSVGGYKLSEVNKSSVLLTKNKKKLLLSTKSDSKKLKFQK